MGSGLKPALRPWQNESASQLVSLLRRYSGAADLSDTGTGKTYTALKVVKELAVPTVIVAPKVVLTTWKTLAEQFGVRPLVRVVSYEAIRSGRTLWGSWTGTLPGTKRVRQLVCDRCQLEGPRIETDGTLSRWAKFPCPYHRAGIHCWKEKKLKNKTGRFVWHDSPQLIIFDEAHRCRAYNSATAKVLLAAAVQNKKVLLLSATLATSPLDFFAIGAALRLYAPLTWNAWVSWVSRFGCCKVPYAGGLHWIHGEDKRKADMAKLGSLVNQRSIRVVADSIPNFPDLYVDVGLYDVENQRAAAEAVASLREKMQAVSGLIDGNNLEIVNLLRAWQQCELLKVPVLKELIDDAILTNQRPVVFARFTETLKQISSLLSVKHGILDGKTPNRERDDLVAAFQKNELECLLVNISVGGQSLSLHDLHGVPRLGLVCPTFSAIDFIQVLGRLRRDGGKSPGRYRVVLLAGTEEAEIAKKLRAKLANLSALTDSDLQFF